MNKAVKSFTANFNPRTLQGLSERELKQRLRNTLIAICVTIAVIFISLVFFAPAIGTLFGFVSKHYGEEEPETEIFPATPAFNNPISATKEESVTLNGFSEPGMTINLFVNGPLSQTSVTDKNGNFTFTNVKLIKGRNTVYAKAVNSKNKESEKSENIYIEFDDKAPEVKMDSPKNNETVKNLDGRILVKGHVDRKATIKINGRLAILKPDLTFELLLGVNEGNVEIKVEATDEAGNKKTETINVTYVKSS